MDERDPPAGVTSRKAIPATARVPFGTLPWEPVVEGARQKTTVRGNKRIRLLELTDSFVEHDWCVKQHAGSVLEGDLEIMFETHVERLGPGDGLLIESDEKHKARALTTRALLLLVEEL